MKKRFFCALLTAALLLSGCTGTEPALSEAAAAPTFSAAETAQEADITLLSPEQFFTSRDLDGGYDAGKIIPLSLEDAADGILTIAEEGVYLLSGSLENGQIIIDAGKSAKVQLVLDGVSIHSETSAAIYCKKADKVFLTLAGGSENTLSCGSSFVPIDDNNIDAAVFAKTDLTLNGSGSLTVTAPAGHGIVSKDALVITGGNYDITAAEHGITGKDAIAIAAGSLHITSGEDGIHAKNADDPEGGLLFLSGGSFTIESAGDALSATGAVRITGGEFTLQAGGGSTAVAMRHPDFAGGFRGGSTAESYGSEVSAKGIKSDASILAEGGSFTLDCADDGVHAGGDILITGGQWEIRTADDGIHSDSLAEIRGGEIRIPYCYEGIEGMRVTVSGGSIVIRSCDDGINAAGGMDGSGFETFRRGGNENNVITVNGGSITIESDGDSLDSNGSLILNGGTLNLTCNGNGNTALDCDGNFLLGDAEVHTNDGSENNPGAMPGGMGGFGGGKGFGSGNGSRENFGERREDFGQKGSRPFEGGDPPERPEGGMPGGMEPPRMPEGTPGGSFPQGSNAPSPGL